MKKRAFIYDSLETLLITVVISLLTVMAVKAENSPDLNSLNGLFTPTQSERSFQAGRENFEREVEILTYPERYWRDDLLQIDPELIEYMDRSRDKTDFDWENSPYELRIDIIEH